MNRRDELDAMYVILSKGCAGMNCMDCPGREYDHCGDYNKAVKLYDAGWHKREKGTWSIKKIGDGGTTRTCSNCLITQTVNVYNGKVMFRYCPYCGAEMEGIEL